MPFRCVNARILNPRFLFAALLLVILLPSARAQWRTQSVDLKAGWNAVFLHVDASYATLDNLVGGLPGSPIEEIWRWNPPSTAQFIEDPQSPNGSGQEWASWVLGVTNLGLNRLVGDSAYLVKVKSAIPTYNWTLKGKPVPPRRAWSVTGLNFIGFPTVPATPPKFDLFLAQAPELQSAGPQIYYYPGGDLGSGNPLQLQPFFFRNTPVKRGQAFWIRAGDVFNRYFGPFEVRLNSGTGVHFGDSLSTYSFRLKNLSPNALTVSLKLVGSESPPAGESGIAGVPPLLVRGAINLTNLTYSYTNLPSGATRQWVLNGRDQEGSEVEVVLGLDRSAIVGNVGDLLAGVLELTDSLGHTRVDLPVSAEVSSQAGLWVGSAAVTQVGEYLKSYTRGAPVPILVTNGNTVVTNDLLITTNGQYVVENINTNLGAVPTAFPLRLIVHNPATGSARLMQRVYYGLDGATNPVVANGEAALNPAHLREARRISATHLPWSQGNGGWAFDGLIAPGANVSTTVTTAFGDQASNPFLHTYHPDHDNLNPRFTAELAQGQESYTIIRDITLNVLPPGDDFASRTAGGLRLTGDYLETIRMVGLARGGGTNDAREFHVRGIFTLNRISNLSTLSIVP